MWRSVLAMSNPWTDWFFRLLYGRVSKGHLIFCRSLGGAGGFTRIAAFDLSQPGQLDAAIAFAESAEGRDCYYKYNLFRGDLITARGPYAIGAKREVSHIVAFALDIDTSAKNPKYLDQQTILWLLNNAVLDPWGRPIPPTVIIGSDGTGKGLHAYWVLQVPLEIQSYDHYCQIKAITSRWYRNLALLMQGCELDATSGPERLLRPPGSTRASGNQVTVLQATGNVYDISQLTLPPTANEQNDGQEFEASEDSVIGEYLDYLGWDVTDIMRYARWTERAGDPSYWDRPEASTASPTAQVYTSGDGRVGVTIKTPGTIYTVSYDPITGDRLPATCPDAPTWMSREKFWVFMTQAGDTSRQGFIACANVCRKLLPRGTEFSPIICDPHLPPPLILSATPEQIRRCKEHLEAMDPAATWLYRGACLCHEWGLDYDQGVAVLMDVDSRLSKTLGAPLTEDIARDILVTAAQRAVRGLRADGTYEAQDFVDPRKLAVAVLRRFGRVWDDRHRVQLRYYREEWYQWNGQNYQVVSDAAFEAMICAQVQHVVDEMVRRMVGVDGFVAPKVSKTVVSNVVMHMKSLVAIPEKQDAPLISADPNCDLYQKIYIPGNVISFRNGLLELKVQDELELLPHDPRFFTVNGLTYRYDPDAKCPVWEKFLHQVFWDEDAQSVDRQKVSLLQEWFGLNLVHDLSFHKILNLIGPPRSGKGTICNVLTELVGEENVASPQLNQLLKDTGLAQLVGKQTAIVADSRIGGTMADRELMVAMLLSISGDDYVSVGRKYKSDLKIKLPCRFTIAANMLGVLPDASGALAARSLFLETSQSFVGREDRSLLSKIRVELPGIFNWAMEGLIRLKGLGDFLQPMASMHLVRQAEAIQNPLGEFIKEFCDIGPTYRYDKKVIYSWADAWYISNKLKTPPFHIFSGNLYAATGNRVRSGRPRATESRSRVYDGIRLKPEFEDKDPAVWFTFGSGSNDA